MKINRKSVENLNKKIFQLRQHQIPNTQSYLYCAQQGVPINIVFVKNLLFLCLLVHRASKYLMFG